MDGSEILNIRTDSINTDKMPEIRVFNRIDMDECRKIFDSSHIGGVHMRGALNQDFCALLREEVLGKDWKNYTNPNYNEIKISIDEFARKISPMLNLLATEYSALIFDPLSQQIGFKK